jgi:hypothetical protein
MLTLTIGADEYFDDETQTFHEAGGFELQLEHSLISLSKWESITKIPFLSKENKTAAQMKLYIQTMIISPVFPPDIVDQLSQEHFDQVTAYIESAESATTFGSMPEVRGRGETITSELIYYWMVAFQIPFECEKWHLNRLFSLIRICNIKNSKPKKMSRNLPPETRSSTKNVERSITPADDWRFDDHPRLGPDRTAILRKRSQQRRLLWR